MAQEGSNMAWEGCNMAWAGSNMARDVLTDTNHAVHAACKPAVQGKLYF